MRNFFHLLPKNIIRIFSGKNLYWHLLAIVLTYIIVVSGFDWNYFLRIRTVSWRTDFFPALMLGSFLPIILPIIFWTIGGIGKKTRMIVLGFATAQASLLGLIVSDLYKTFTGRIQPPEHFHNVVATANEALVDISHGFRFGFLRGGVFWGWPSSHTTVSFALAFAIWAMFPKNKIIRTIAVVYAFYVGIGTSVTAIHWFSEFVAGAIIGTVVGLVVGKSFLKGYELVTEKQS